MDMSSCLASSLVVLDEVSVVPDTANVIKHILIRSNMNSYKAKV